MENIHKETDIKNNKESTIDKRPAFDYLRRSELILGEKALSALSLSNVFIAGLGGVGSYACEAIARAGAGGITLADGDRVELSNLNRQLPALRSTIGKMKVDCEAERIADINPECEITKIGYFIDQSNIDAIDFSKTDYIVDCIDDIKAKLLLAEKAKDLGIRIISVMGTGKRINPAAFRIMDIFDTSYCPLAKRMRRELRLMGIKKLKVVASDEEPLLGLGSYSETERPSTPASLSFVPPVAGFIAASEVILELLEMRIPGYRKALENTKKSKTGNKG